jgi:hypothetical protein
MHADKRGLGLRTEVVQLLSAGRISPICLLALGLARAETYPLSAEQHDAFVMSAGSEAVGFSDAEVLKRFGTPKRVSRKRIPNPYAPEQLDEIVEIVYDGLSAKFYKLPDKQFALQIVVRDSKIRLPYGLAVGATTDHVIRVLGKPSSVTDGRLKFGLSQEGYPLAVYFNTARGIVQSVEWQGYVD